MDIFNELDNPDTWRLFLEYKTEQQNLCAAEKQELADFIEGRRYVPLVSRMREPDYTPPYPEKREINKIGTSKKRVVYTFDAETNTVLKLISWLLHCYDGLFLDNCYAFRRDHGAKAALSRLRRIRNIEQKYALKADIHNYFNSIDVPLLLEKLSFLKEDNPRVYDLLEKILTADRAWQNGHLIREKRGAMAGTPMSPFFANVYLSDVDQYFKDRNVPYFRYSDDILLFADSREELDRYENSLNDMLTAHGLALNPDKVAVYSPGTPIEFLGFRYYEKNFDLSSVTLEKMKAKIRRKAHALRRWQQGKDLPPEKAAIGFIRAMNRKLFEKSETDDFSWCRWFFPNITVTDGLHEIDIYLQQYIRYCVTGRHYKGNYRISYDQLKEWGYRNLVHEYYAFRKGNFRDG